MSTLPQPEPPPSPDAGPLRDPGPLRDTGQPPPAAPTVYAGSTARLPGAARLSRATRLPGVHALAVPRASSGAVRPDAPEDAEEPLIPWPRPRLRPRPGPVPARAPVRRPRGTRSPVAGLSGLVLVGLLATFLAWVSAQPAWLAVGHGTRASATVTRCSGQGLGRSCVATVTAHGVESVGVRLVGARVRAGDVVPVRVVSASSRVAYAGPASGLVLRALLGLVLVLACGALAVWVSGAARLPRPGRLLAVPASLAAPLVLALGVLAAAW